MRISRTYLLLVGLTTLIALGLSATSSADSIDVTSGTTPTLDSTISANEWADAGHVNVSVAGTNGSVYFKHDGVNLYMAFEYSSGQMAEVYIDKDHDAGTAPGTDDVCLHASTALMERTGTGSAWSGWTTTITGWDADTGYPNVREFSIAFSFLGITSGTPKTMGALLYLFTISEGDVWPSSSEFNSPDTWGDMSSSDSWVAVPNTPPVLSGPTFTPSSGETTTEFRFEVMYKDAEALPPTIARIHINAYSHDMMTDSSGPWDDWVTYYFETQLSAGDAHKFQFSFSDGTDPVRLPAITDVPNRLDGPVVTVPNREPVLDGSWSGPATGTRLDTFEFTINYTDADNDATVTSQLYLDDEPVVMSGSGTGWNRGVTFSYSTSLDLGTHQYYFLFSDGTVEVRFPASGHLEGPVVTNLDPIAVMPAPGDGLRYSPDDYVPFTSSGTSDPEEDDLEYSWTSDLDGLLSEQPAFDMLLSEGSHLITLNVTDEYGGNDSISISILVRPYLPRPFIDVWSASIEAPIEGDTMTYTVTVDNDGEATIQDLEVGFLLDGFVKAVETVRVYVDSPVDVVFTWVAEPGDLVVRFVIDGDHVVFTQHVEPNTPPTVAVIVAGAEGDPPRYRVGHMLTFTATPGDAEGDALDLLWDMDDGTTMPDVDILTHAYVAHGTYEVTLTVTDARGGSTVGTVTIEVHGNSLPAVEITPTSTVVRGDTVSFDAEVSDEDGDSLTFLWDFGDDETSTWEAAKHVYEEPGTYTVTLTVTDSEGGVTVRTIEVVVEKPKKDDDDESPGFGTIGVLVALASALVLMTRRR